jgi:protein required for attachment to host cells
MKPINTWILLADGARARIVSNAGPGKGVEEVSGMEFSGDNERTGEVMADRPGRSFDSAGSHRHAMEPPSDAHREMKRDFANDLVKALEKKLKQHAFDRLVLIAAPATLGDLRNSMSKALQNVIYAEVPKDLVHVPNSDIASHLADVLAV